MAAADPFDFREFFEINETVKEVVKELVCHVCRGYPKPFQPRWYKCADLHYICQFCVESKKVDKCSSSCKKKISKNPDKMAETVLKMKTMKFKCRYCKESFTSEAITLHETECTQRLVFCPLVHMGKCDKRVKFQDVLTHFESAHGKVCQATSGSACKMTCSTKVSSLPKNRVRIPNKIEVFGKVFLSLALIKDGTVYDWVQLLGSPSEAKDFVFSLEYKGARSTHAYFGEVASIDETFNSIISRGKCSTVNSELFKIQYMVDNEANKAEYSYTVTIKKLDEETK